MPEHARKPLRIGMEEIRDVLADEGYSADGRKARLKEMLTALQQDEAGAPSRETRRLIDEIKAIIRQQQSGEPLSDDVF